MNFLISDTFTSSLAKLTNEEQKQVKLSAFDLQTNPTNPGLQFHKLDRCRDDRFWSIRVSRDVRIIVHRSDGNLLLCYVDHHDDAYKWAERRKLETHPTTGAAQIVEIREVLREEESWISSSVSVEPEVTQQPPLFAEVSDSDLFAYGIPEEWLTEVKAVSEEQLFDLVFHLPSEAMEALLELAVGGKPEIAVAEKTPDPFEHPDAKRRFQLITNEDALREALDYPLEKWSVFLHPSQRDYVERDFSGPARISGSAGTGKTVVALHRAARLAREHPEERILLTTFSPLLAKLLHLKILRLLPGERNAIERIDIIDLDSLVTRMTKRLLPGFEIIIDEFVSELFKKIDNNSGLSDSFLLQEWKEIVDSWQLPDWNSYMSVKRLGRKSRLPETKRKAAWEIFSQVLDSLTSSKKLTTFMAYGKLQETLSDRSEPIYSHVVVDEAQDINVPQLRLLKARGFSYASNLFFCGDIGQRIFQFPYSWLAEGVDIRGRSHRLRINYRTSQQIRERADQLLEAKISDMDGGTESRTDTISLFEGPEPQTHMCENQEDEIRFVSDWISGLIGTLAPEEICILVRHESLLDRALSAVEMAEQSSCDINSKSIDQKGSVFVGTMDKIKGLEFKAVAVMACDDEILPFQPRIDSITDESDLKEVYDTERHLFYVACTRARDSLLLTSNSNPSEFLHDLCI